MIEIQAREEFNRWPPRLPRIVATLNELNPDIIGSQELYQSQLDDLIPFVENNFSFYGEPRSDGELNGVFYRKDRFELIKGHVWSIPPKGKITNNVTMAHFKDRLTGQHFAIFNTHLAIGANEREHEIRFILEIIEPIANQMPVMLTGDLNTFPHRQDLTNLPYYDGDYIQRLITKKYF